MYRLIYNHCNLKHEVTAGTEDEILSLAIDCFNSNCELFMVLKDQELIYGSKELYEKIKKAYY
jgi:hypothetical protein